MLTVWCKPAARPDWRTSVADEQLKQIVTQGLSAIGAGSDVSRDYDRNRIGSS